MGTPTTRSRTSWPSSCRQRSPSMPPSRTKENDDMRSFFARAMLRKFSKRYGYDVSYLDYMLKQSPAAFFKFAGLGKASAHREVVPVDASFAAKITGAM